MNLKHLVRRATNLCGYEFKRLQPLPSGRDWIVDVGRVLTTTKPRVVFDVGANVGEVSLRLAVAFPPPARIFAFEPAASTFRTLKSRLTPYAHVHCLHTALGQQPGRLKLYHGINSQLNRLSTSGATGDGTFEEVEVSTIDAVADRFAVDSIDVLKTDTEGFDASVLQGALGLLKRGAVRAIISEATFDLQCELHTRFDDIRAVLAPYGFYLHGIYDVEHWGEHLKYANVLFLRKP
jgi:FkbM family methyltransferase